MKDGQEKIGSNAVKPSLTYLPTAGMEEDGIKKRTRNVREETVE